MTQVRRDTNPSARTLDERAVQREIGRRVIAKQARTLALLKAHDEGKVDRAGLRSYQPTDETDTCRA